MDSFLKSVFVRAGKHTSVHDVHPHTTGAIYIINIRCYPGMGCAWVWGAP